MLRAPDETHITKKHFGRIQLSRRTPVNSVKTVAVVIVFLGVVYGVYQVINSNGSYVEDDSPIMDGSGNRIVGGLGVEVDAESLSPEELEAALFNSDPGLGSETEGDFSLDFDMDEFGSGSNDSSKQIPSTTEKTAQLPSRPSTNFQPADRPGKSDFDADTFNSFGDPPSEPKKSAPIPQSTPPKLNAPQTSSEPSKPQSSANSFSPAGQGSQQADFNTTGNTPNSQFTPPSNSPFGKASDLIAASAVEAESTASLNAEFQSQGAFPSTATPAQKQATLPKTQDADSAQSEMQTSAFASNDFGQGASSQSEFTPATQIDPQSNGVSLDANTLSEKRISPPTNGQHDLAAGWDRAKLLIEQNRFPEALALLSQYQGDPRLSPAESKNLLSWIDPLAGKVIYSTEHLVTNAYLVRPGDTLSKIANQHRISESLLYNINRVNIPNRNLLVPGSTLKVVPGPFNAELDLKENRLTLFLGDMYAGHFWVSLGQAAPRPGEYSIQHKSDQGFDFLSKTGTTIPANAPSNPYGRYWLGLDNGCSIHSTASSGSVEDTRGSVSLSPIDAEDVFGILTVGSRLTVR
jgi:LysM repeat protein